MRRFVLGLSCVVLTIAIGLGISGCSPTETGGGGKMETGKMGADKMGSDKMSSDKMSSDKMSSDKMGSEK
jgi:pentapeptide MXKDX repeat protein